MAYSVPDTSTFSLQDVIDIVIPSVNDLSTCFIESEDLGFNSLYKGNKDRLSNFRDYFDVNGDFTKLTDTGEDTVYRGVNCYYNNPVYVDYWTASTHPTYLIRNITNRIIDACDNSVTWRNFGAVNASFYKSEYPATARTYRYPDLDVTLNTGYYRWLWIVDLDIASDFKISPGYHAKTFQIIDYLVVDPGSISNFPAAGGNASTGIYTGLLNYTTSLNPTDLILTGDSSGVGNRIQTFNVSLNTGVPRLLQIRIDACTGPSSVLFNLQQNGT